MAAVLFMRHFIILMGGAMTQKTFSKNEFPHAVVNENALEEILKYLYHTLFR